MGKVRDRRGLPSDSERPAASGTFPVAVAASGEAPAPPPAATPAGRKPRSNGSPGKARQRETSAVGCLARALKAKTPAERSRHARAGLVAVCDLETQGLLLRQLYLGELEAGKFEHARDVAQQLITLNVLPDVARHDAARACQALGALDQAVDHLAAAVVAAPAERRGFHLSTLGGLLYASGRPAEACAPLRQAIEAADATQPLLRGQLALARHAAGEEDPQLELAYHELQHDRSGEGYGRFVLGELAFARGDRRAAQVYLEAFLAKVRRSRPAARAALSPEVARATETLGRIVLN